MKDAAATSPDGQARAICIGGATAQMFAYDGENWLAPSYWGRLRGFVDRPPGRGSRGPRRAPTAGGNAPTSSGSTAGNAIGAGATPMRHGRRPPSPARQSPFPIGASYAVRVSRSATSRLCRRASRARPRGRERRRRAVRCHRWRAAATRGARPPRIVRAERSRTLQRRGRFGFVVRQNPRPKRGRADDRLVRPPARKSVQLPRSIGIAAAQ